MLSKLRIWVGATALAVLATSGGVVAAHAEYTPPTIPPFTDVATSHTFYKETSWLAEKEISTGYANGNGSKRFEPSGAVLREQMAAFLYRLAGKPTYTAPATPRFTDVPISHTFYKEISWLAEKEISTGYNNGNSTWSFRPGQPVLREQMAAFLYRYAEISPDAGVISGLFADIPANHTFRRQIDWLAARRISTGYAGNPIPDFPGFTTRVFMPAAPVLREQMAAFMYRLEDVDGTRTPPAVATPESIDVQIGQTFAEVLTDPRSPDGAWSIRSGSLPPGVNLVNRSPFVTDGVATIEGAPLSTGTFTVTVRYQHGLGDRADRTIVITVTDPNGVDPEEAATRSDVATSLYRCEAPDVTLPATSPFADLPLSDPRFAAVYWAHQTGLIPVASGTARPDEELTRALTAEFLYRYAGAGLLPGPGQEIFDDVTISHPNYVAINWAGQTNAIPSEPPRLFQPDKLATKADSTRFQYLVDCAVALD